MYWRAVGVGVGWGVGYLAVCYLLAPLESVGLVAVPVVLGAGPLAGAAAGWWTHDDVAVSVRHGLLAGAVTGLLFAAALWHVMSVSRFNSVTPFGNGGAFFALKLTFAHSASDFAVIAQYPGRVAGAFALGGGTLVALLGGYAGYVAATRETTIFIR